MADTLINAATLIAALTAAIVSVLALRAQGQQKVAEFRKEWIEGLRENVSDFLAHDAQIKILDSKLKGIFDTKGGFNANLLPKLQEEGLIAHRERLQSSTQRIKAYELIHLKLNVDEDLHNILSDRLSKALADETSGKHHQEIIEATRNVTKVEWDRLVNEVKLKGK